MTADKIAQLTDEQARDAVAEALGRQKEFMVSAYSPRITVGFDWIDANGKYVAGPDWSPCANIADAWPLFMRLNREHPFKWQIIGMHHERVSVSHIKSMDDTGDIIYDCECHGVPERAIVNAYLWAQENGMLRKDGEG